MMNSVVGRTLALAVVLLAPAETPLSAQPVSRQLSFTSSCPSPLRLFVYHRHNNGQMATHGWFNFIANQPLTTMVGGGGSPLVHLDGETLYIYAEATDGSGRVWEGETPAQFNGITYRLRTAALEVSGGRMFFRLSCPAQAATATRHAPTSVDPGATATGGTMALASGFTPDPRTLNVTAGGSIPSSSVARSCSGYVPVRPQLTLDYRAGSLPLILSASSSLDTVLLVRTPDGSYRCDDDSGQDLNPSVRFNQPSSGRYTVWVGSYSSGVTAGARVHVSELTSQ